MKLRLLLVVFAVSFTSQVGRVQESGDNPFRKAKVGDYVTYKMTTKIMDKAIDGTMKQLVTAKSDSEATIKTTATVLGMEASAQEEKIDLTKPYDPAKAALSGNEKGKFEKTGEGKEKIKLGDKTYDCTYLKGKVAAEAAGIKIDSEVKMWFSSAVPLGGLVKMEMKSNFANLTMEFSGSGQGK
jgi:hypothetical protein